MTPRARIVLDVDTGIDDALALLYAVTSPSLDLRGVTTVTGNVAAEVAARNSAAVLARVGAEHVPVAVGAGRTTHGRGPRPGPTNHGPDGLGGVVVPPGPAADADPEALVGEAAHGGDLVLVGLAPMTNVVRLAPLTQSLVLVGGELAPEAPSDFNAAHDPGATARALAANRPTTLYVVDVLEQVVVTGEDVARLRASERLGARLAGELLHVRRAHLIGDAGALVLLTHPHLFVIERRRMGMLGDALTEVPDGRLLDVVVAVDVAGVASAYVETMLSGA